MASGDLSFVYAGNGQLAGTVGDLYEVPAGKTVIHFDLWLCNTDDAAAHRSDVHVTDASKTATTTNQLINGVAGVTDLRAGESRPYSGDQFVPAGYWFRGLASTAAKISWFLSVVLREN